MTDAHPIVGPEGLASDLEGLARQISAVEKNSEIRFVHADSNSAARAQKNADLINLHMHYRDMLNDLRAEYARASYVRDREDIRLALNTLDNRLAGFPREYARLDALADLGDRMTRFEDATRSGMELIDKRANDNVIALERKLVESTTNIEKRLNEGLTRSGEQARAEGRPGQDMKAGQAAIIAAIAFVVVILGGIGTVVGLFLALR